MNTRRQGGRNGTARLRNEPHRWWLALAAAVVGLAALGWAGRPAAAPVFSLKPYDELIERVDRAVGSINRRSQLDRSIDDGELHPPSVEAGPEVEPEPERAAEHEPLPAPPLPRASFKVDGIIHLAGKPVATVNRQVVGVGDSIAGHRVVAIGYDTVSLAGSEGSVTNVSVYQNLEKYAQPPP